MRLLGAKPRNDYLRWFDRALIVFGVVCLGYYVSATARTAAYQNRANAQLQKRIVSNNPLPDSAPPDAPVAAEPETPLKPGDLIGRVDVPRLNMSAAVAEGDDDSTLGKAVGHLPDTPLPWQGSGNVAFAAHRDGLFRPLKDIRVGDDVRVVTTRGEFAYRVSRTQIVEPDDVWVIAPTANATLTLITCYPFSYIGHAPRRFVVQAERLEADPAGVAIKGTVIQ